jgi:hypothetical protein
VSADGLLNYISLYTILPKTVLSETTRTGRERRRIQRSTGSTTLESSFAGLLTRVETGYARISSSG